MKKTNLCKNQIDIFCRFIGLSLKRRINAISVIAQLGYIFAFHMFLSSYIHFIIVHLGARCSSMVRAFAHGAMGHWINPSWGGPIELFLIPASAPRLV